jgi:hypothetical protein
MIANTAHPRSRWRSGMRFTRSMGTPRSGTVVRAMDLPYALTYELNHRSPFRSPVIPVRYDDDGEFGYEHPQHLTRLAAPAPVGRKHKCPVCHAPEFMLWLHANSTMYQCSVCNFQSESL